MAVPIILLYAFGIVFFLLTLEEELEYKSLIYAITSVFFNIIAYYISFSDADYVNLSYIPLALIIISTLILIYRVYGYLPKNSVWGDSEEEEYRFQPDLN